MKNDQFKIFQRASRVLKVMAHPVRMQLVDILLQDKEDSVGELQKKIGISQSMTSQHLSLLKGCGIIACKKEANICRYYIENKDIINLIRCVENCA